MIVGVGDTAKVAESEIAIEEVSEMDGEALRDALCNVVLVSV